jgi:hypothetical protein
MGQLSPTQNAKTAGTALAVGAQTKCGEKMTLLLEKGKTSAFCTLKPRHKGDHYDDVFLLGWKRAE